MIIEEVQLIYRNKQRASDRLKIKKAKDAYNAALSSWDMDRIQLIEEFKALFLDRQNRLMSIANIATGGMTEVFVDLRVVFSIALKRRASAIILIHNHPSGSLKPSKPDIHLTQKFSEAGSLMNIPILDHLIITEDGFHSIIHEN